MSDAPGIGGVGSPNGGGTRVQAAIARAAAATGVDFKYLMAQAKLESSMDPGARASTSSAAGLYQFTQGTWVETLDRHADRHGLDWVGSAIDGGRITDPTMRAQIMSLRYDPDTSAMMAAELASDNRAELTGVLGREPDSSELYLAHFLGISGASQFLSALDTNPSQSAASILPKAAAANRGIFYDGGAPRSVGGVMDLIRGKVSQAMNGEAPAQWATMSTNAQLAAAPAAPQSHLGPIAREFHAGLGEAPQMATRSMSATLQGTFGSGSGADAAPAHVRNAYAKLARFGL
ncbi:lytic transglycosylase domain-containing protein [Novosphingobium sp. PY1]|uniref:lytic transglycosylase domain-containing protein n=1 Tax=Novosphingobium sp. PY1 TaxID=1882221 RepID=UPI001F5DDC84|nr:lytic transglycosylase domain-containing protein [Novosphingobium sp. PY1]